MSFHISFSLKDVIRAASLAMSYRQKFRRDVIIDLLCYRRLGHNEMDEPSFTQPKMYSKINSRLSVPDLYAQSLVVGVLFLNWTEKLSCEGLDSGLWNTF